MRKYRFLCLALALMLAVTGCAGMAEPEATEVPAPQTTEAPQANEGTGPIVLAWSQRTMDAPADYRYNAQGQMVRKIQPDWGWVTEYTYHPNGALAEARVYEDGQLERVTEYDDHGNVVREQYALSDGSLVTDRTYTNTYDDQGRLIYSMEEAIFDLEEVYCVSQQAFRYTYYPDGSYDKEWDCRNIENGVEYRHCYWIRRYNAAGTLVEKEQPLDNMSEYTDRTVYELDEHGNYLRCVYTWGYDNRLVVKEYNYFNTYADDGSLIRVEEQTRSYESVDGQVTEMETLGLAKVTDYLYDDQGRMIREIITYSEDYVVEHIWEYDEWGNLSYFYGIPEGDWEETEERYEYRPLSEVLE